MKSKFYLYLGFVVLFGIIILITGCSSGEKDKQDSPVPHTTETAKIVNVAQDKHPKPYVSGGYIHSKN